MKQIFKNKTGLLVVLIVGILAMTIAFAAMSTQLNIFGTAKISSGSYKVVIDDWTQTTTSSLVSGATNTGYQITAASVTSNTMTISGLKVGFKQPGDAVKYTFNIENQGSIDASLSSFTLGTPTCTNATTSESVTCPSMTYEVKCGSPAAVPASGDNLLAGQTISCYYYLAYNVVDASSLNQPAIEVGNINASWTYTQKATNSYTPSTTKYKLTLNSMGGSSVSNIEALGGSDITLPEPTKSGYNFDGWYTEETGGTKITSNTMPTSNTTYYAHWTLSDPSICQNNQNIEVGSGIICKRAAQLHTDTCSNGSSSDNNYCYADGYYEGGSKDTTTIMYGNCGSGTTIQPGDAFDCKVSTSGDYTERFYYISDYYNTSTKTFDNTYASLIYSSSVSSGNASNKNASDYSSLNINYEGPRVATNLPTTVKWNNVSLKTTSRQVLSMNNNQTSTTNTTNYGNTRLGTAIGYKYNSDNSTYYSAGRLLTYQELLRACPNAKNFTLTNATGSLSSCNFLFENTMYSTSTNPINFIWMETVRYDTTESAWGIQMDKRYINSLNVKQYAGVRPVIEVPYSAIQLQ